MIIQIKEIKKLLNEGKKVFIKTVNGEYTKINAFIDKGILDTYLVELKNGYSIKVTGTHRFFTNSGWVETNKLVETESMILCDDNTYQPVTKVSYISKYKIVDISVEHEEQAYFGNGMLNHNSGKSSVAYHIAKNTQKRGGVVAYFDTENAFSWDLAERVGLNTKENFIYFTDISVEKVLQSIQIVVDQFVKDKQLKDVPLLIVWDSIAQTPTEKELEGDYDVQQVGGIAKVLTPGLRKLIPTIQKSKVTLLFINQERDKIGGMGFGEQTTTPGGKILQYAATVILRLSRLAWIKDEKNGDKDAVGIKIIAETKKNKIAPPMRKTEFDFFYSTGIDDSGHVWDIMAKNPTGKYYKRSGNTVTVDGVDYSKQKFLTAFNTEGKFRDLVIDSIAEFKIRRFDQLGKPDEDSDVVAEPDVN